MRNLWIDWIIDLTAFFALVAILFACVVAITQVAITPTFSQKILSGAMLLSGLAYMSFYAAKLTSFATRKRVRR